MSAMSAHRPNVQTAEHRTIAISDATLAELRGFSEWNKPHWRAFIDRRGELTTVCIQPTDYAVSTWAGTFLDEEWYPTETDAERALERFSAIWDGH